MKYSGKIGFWIDDLEVRPGVYKSDIVERVYTGDILRNSQRWNNTEHINKNITISNKVSIIADLYLNEHLSSIKYIEWMGTKWCVSSIDINYPRITLEIGEVYNGIDGREET